MVSQLTLPGAARRPRAYHVGYRLTLAELRRGRPGPAYFAYASRCFGTNELNVLLADIYAEVGPAANLLGIEILTIRRATTAR